MAALGFQSACPPTLSQFHLRTTTPSVSPHRVFGSAAASPDLREAVMDIHELLEQVELKEVRLIERYAQLLLDPSPGHGLQSLSDATPEGDLALDINPISWSDIIEIWFRMQLTNEHMTVRCAVAVVYQREPKDEIDSDVQKDFIERVAVMTAYPYLRAELQHQVADLRLGTLTLGVLRQGEFELVKRPLTDVCPPSTS